MIRALAAALLTLWPVAAQAEWQEASSDHFTVYSDDKPANVARFAERLERFDKTLRMLTSIPATPVSPANRVTVYVVNDTSTVAKLSGSANVAGFYIPRAGGSLAIVPKSAGQSADDLSEEQVLFHEYTHHFMLSNWADGAFPAWFVEGFAEFFAPTRIRANDSIEVARPPMYRGYAFANGLPVSAQTLLTGDPKKVDVDAIYAEGWLLTHLLLTDPKRRGQLDGYMAAINAGKTGAQAAAAFGDLTALNRDLRTHLTSGLKYRIIPPGTVPQAKVTVRALGPGEAATMKARIRSKRGVDAKEAQVVLALAQRAAAYYPNDPAAQVVLAEAEYDAGNHGAAEAAARRAVAADPKSVDGHVYIGMARMAAAQVASSQDAAQWRDIRRSFLAANTIENDDPEPLMLFYRSFAAAGREPSANAREALARAQSLAPQDRSLRMETAMMLLETNKPAEAKRMLGPVAYSPHGGEMATLAATVIKAIDDAGATGALAKWRAAETKPEKPAG
ncbi:hypothetical protein ASG37_07280 [Sphingomonas sp. Leaf407]|uniref:hypothetical protein n=1 Tax=unclassified Sphingomonas TaxID=196159 RepID=UPI00070021EF|nr:MULTISPECIES: hypothetical protein [unclassified Sphingomonas]KQN39369.1 hypothetical protein ASE97_04570 [Sphingomonas sp. Leaf42]KQT28645.1 hypothetical protein ASG37_07280 [Sphingomonas sp. Leaf407]